MLLLVVVRWRKESVTFGLPLVMALLYSTWRRVRVGVFLWAGCTDTLFCKIGIFNRFRHVTFSSEIYG
jgi:hypothetical protein